MSPEEEKRQSQRFFGDGFGGIWHEKKRARYLTNQDF